jgi:hypothetical protein
MMRFAAEAMMTQDVIVLLGMVRRCRLEDAQAGMAFKVLDAIGFAEQAVRAGRITATDRAHFRELLIGEILNPAKNKKKYQTLLRKVLFGFRNEHPAHGAVLIERNLPGRSGDASKLN